MAQDPLGNSFIEPIGPPEHDARLQVRSTTRGPLVGTVVVVVVMVMMIMMMDDNDDDDVAPQVELYERTEDEEETLGLLDIQVHPPTYGQSIYGPTYREPGAPLWPAKVTRYGKPNGFSIPSPNSSATDDHACHAAG
jgi:hypothetical protein